MRPRARALMTGKWCVDDGEGPIVDECPCCGKALTEAAATVIVEQVQRGEFSMEALRMVADMRGEAEREAPEAIVPPISRIEDLARAIGVTPAPSEAPPRNRS